MPTAETSIDVAVPINVAYNQWTQFEEFPHFMADVQAIEQLDDRRLHWVISIGGVLREFDAEITEQNPDERVAWRATRGMDHSGVVSFHRLSDNATRVMLQLEMAAQDAVEATADTTGALLLAVKRDLKNFKDFIEARGAETGAWRGEIPRDG